jgi:hypothetical protein
MILHVSLSLSLSLYFEICSGSAQDRLSELFHVFGIWNLYMFHT